jgi:hypothetical protein
VGIGANFGLIGLAQPDHGTVRVDHTQANAVLTARPATRPAPDD